MTRPPPPPSGPCTTTRSQATAADGVLVVDKPSGPTSFDVVAQARRLFGTRSVGHAGTLDPLATGVLVLMLGEATKLSDYLTAADKSYEAEITFGRSTDTLDITGTTTQQHSLPAGWLDRTQLEAVLHEERLRTAQVPPAFSAIKQNGKRAYDRARRGENVVLPPRAVRVHQLSVLSVGETNLRLTMRVGKGYYVRSLARDICERLGVNGCLSSLRRTASGPFTLEEACPWPVPSESPSPVLLPLPAAAGRALPVAMLTDDGVTQARHGKRLNPTHFAAPPPAGSVCAWFSGQGNLVALGEQRIEPPAAGVGPACLTLKVLRGFRAPTP